ncbi:methyltransferase domain-containing protein [Paroceanicella profunda]|uniref:Methyltransferase domain-containing protein n=1 Tax=Paroceanicella profunda TaxID=2579971 RepID=A0A5B8FV07_9RHOB|nr:methyltransferase domain-containing protein [Paroceanicella profunda]QDL92616.1 methyltransferase domain-containing protein [Paroceanicella profunda]
MSEQTFWQLARETEGPGATEALWTRWAEVYDAEMLSFGYCGPERCAAALARFAGDRTAPLIDIGCGTGLSAAALQAEGFTTIDGIDISQAMLDRAAAGGRYRALMRGDIGEPLPWEPGTYANAAAVGTFFPGHMPATAIDAIMAGLPSGGCFVFTLSDYAIAQGGFEGRLREQVDTGHAEFLFKEQGDQLPGIGMTSTVYVLRHR